MSSPTESALKLTKHFEHCISALNGALHAYLDSDDLTNRRLLNRFEAKALEIATHSFGETIKELQIVSDLISSEARSKACIDANSRETGGSNFTESDTAEIVESIRLMYGRLVVEGVRVANKISNQCRTLVISGAHPTSARISVREQHRGEVLKVYSYDKSGKQRKANWGLYLRLAAFLTELKHTQYMKQAAVLGYSKFVIVQPGHARDGFVFTLNSVPDKELHPQSQAEIRLLGRE